MGGKESEENRAWARPWNLLMFTSCSGRSACEFASGLLLYFSVTADCSERQSCS